MATVIGSSVKTLAAVFVLVSAVAAMSAGQEEGSGTSVSHTHPAWSPDGRWIAFVERPAEGREPGDLYLVDPTGAEVRRLTETRLWEFHPAWSPDGGRLAFQRASDPSVPWRIGLLDVDGSNREKITVPDGSASVPAFSPDGDSVAVSVSRDGSSAIYVMALDGSGLRRLSPGDGEHSRPAWSPDGSMLLYDQRPSRDAPWQLFIVNRDGSGLRQLTTEGGDDGSFSPDGSRVLFSSDRSGTRYEVWIMNADGSGQRSLTADIEGSASGGTFSPDGDRIAFSVFNDGRSSLWVMDATGADARQLAVSGR